MFWSVLRSSISHSSLSLFYFFLASAPLDLRVKSVVFIFSLVHGFVHNGRHTSKFIPWWSVPERTTNLLLCMTGVCVNTSPVVEQELLALRLFRPRRFVFILSFIHWTHFIDVHGSGHYGLHEIFVMRALSLTCKESTGCFGSRALSLESHRFARKLSLRIHWQPEIEWIIGVGFHAVSCELSWRRSQKLSVFAFACFHLPAVCHDPEQLMLVNKIFRRVIVWAAKLLGCVCNAQL